VGLLLLCSGPKLGLYTAAHGRLAWNGIAFKHT
jgi:hypothetical protein